MVDGSQWIEHGTLDTKSCLPLATGFGNPLLQRQKGMTTVGSWFWIWKATKPCIDDQLFEFLFSKISCGYQNKKPCTKIFSLCIVQENYLHVAQKVVPGEISNCTYVAHEANFGRILKKAPFSPDDQEHHPLELISTLRRQTVGSSSGTPRARQFAS